MLNSVESNPAESNRSYDTDWGWIHSPAAQVAVPARVLSPWSFSLLLHGGLMTAALMTSRMPQWTSDVARGRAVQLTVSMGAAASLTAIKLPPIELPVDEMQPLGQVLPKLEPRDVEASKQTVEQASVVPVTNVSEAELLSAVTVNRLELNHDADNLAARAEPPMELPDVPATVEAMVRPRRALSSSATGPVLPTTIEQLAGASIEEPPTPDPQNPPPTYPADAQREQRQGRVILSVRIDTQGAVVSISVSTSSGHIDLDQAALEAVLRWKFSPGKSRGNLVSADVFVPVKFTIRPRS